MGDITGLLTIIWIEDALNTLRHWSQQRRINNIPSITLANAVGRQEGVKFLSYKVHSDMISCIQYLPSLNRIITSSIQSGRSLIMGRVFKTKYVSEKLTDLTNNYLEGVTDFNAEPQWRRREDEIVFPLNTGCRSFDVWEEKKWIAAGGMDRIIWVFSIYVPNMAIAKLRGHIAAIFKVSFDPASGTLFSICMDKAIKVWQMYTNTLIHTFEAKTTKINGPILYSFCPTTENVLVQSSDDTYIIRMKRQGDEIEEEGVTHPDVITAIMYNPQHQYLMSCSSEDILVWDVNTGMKVAEFNTIGGDGSMHLDKIQAKMDQPEDIDNKFIIPQPLVHGRENVDTYNVGTVTCVTMDEKGRRFFTAHASGVIKVWNYYNGRNLYNLYKPTDNADICDMHYITIDQDHRYLVTVGWDRKVIVYLDTQGPEIIHQIGLPDEPMEFIHKELGHLDDIWSVTFSPGTNLLASGDYSGRILVWNISSGHIVGFLKPNPLQDAALVKERFVACLHFHNHTVRSKVTTYLLSSGPYHLLHIWRANSTRELNVGSVGFSRPCAIPRDYVTSMKSIPENNWVVCADTWGSVSIWEVVDNLGDSEPTEWFPKDSYGHQTKDATGFQTPGTHSVLNPPGSGKKKMGAKLERVSGRHRVVNRTFREELKDRIEQAEKQRQKKEDKTAQLRAQAKAKADAEEDQQIQCPGLQYTCGVKPPSRSRERTPSIYGPHRKKPKPVTGLESTCYEGRYRRPENENKANESKELAELLGQRATGVIPLENEKELVLGAKHRREVRLRERERVRAEAMEHIKAKRKIAVDQIISKAKAEKKRLGYGQGPVQLSLIRTWKCHVDSFACLEVCTSQGVIATGGGDRSVRLWDYEGRHIGIFGQKHEWSVGDFLSYAPYHPLDVMFDIKRIRSLDVFRKPPPKQLPIEKKADSIVKRMLEQAKHQQLIDLDIGRRAEPYETLMKLTCNATVWTSANAPIGPYRRLKLDFGRPTSKNERKNRNVRFTNTNANVANTNNP